MIMTALTRHFDLKFPIALAPMGGVAGGELAAAVSNAGALGLVGGGYCDAAWLRTELERARELTRNPWGVGLITWAVKPDTLDLVLAYRPHAVMLSFGDPRPLAPPIKKAKATLICQVQDIEGAKLAREAGADFIVAQGAEAGGHGHERSALALMPAVIDAVAPIPVLLAGGIADGRGVAASLALGAAGALIGTRFYASRQALGSARAKQRLVECNGSDTLRTTVFDIVRGYDWPGSFTGRSLRNGFTDRWHGSEAQLAAALDSERPAYFAAAAADNTDIGVVWAGEGIDLIDSIEDAAMLTERLGREAETHLRRRFELLELKN